jgi:uncharacterized membrane protein
MGALRLLALMGLAIAMAMMILGFSRYERSQPLIGGVMTYGVGLLTSAAMLWFFGRLDGCGTAVAVAQIVVLAFPAALGLRVVHGGAKYSEPTLIDDAVLEDLQRP